MLALVNRTKQMPKLLITALISLCYTIASAQIMYTRAAHVNVQSNNNIKNIEADNYQVNSLIDLSENSITFEGLLKSFEFKLGVIDRAFSSDRVKLNKYPKIRFEGTISGLDQLNLNEFGEYPVEVNGTLFIWDEKRKTSAKGTLTSIGDGQQVFASSGFKMRIEEASMKKLNGLIEEKLPLGISAKSFGVSRDILILFDGTYKVK